LPKGQKIKCTRCSYRGQFIVKVENLRNVACPNCQGKLKFVEGDAKMVKARVKQMKRKQSKKASKKARKKAVSNRPVGRTSGVGVMATWVAAFQHNAKVAATKRRTDKEISAYMKKEFPGRKSAIFDAVQLVRNRYNKGALTKGAIPTRQSKRHGE